MRPHYIGLSLLLIFGTANASAEAGDQRRDGRMYQVQNISLERRDQLIEQQQEPERRRAREFDLPEPASYDVQADSQSIPAADNARRPGRLSLEERRALRRQIDEVGHDIYVPKR